MNLNLTDQYYLKARDVYPYDMESTVENLQYALSYDDGHAAANCLMGQVFMYQFKEYTEAIYWMERSLCHSMEYPDTYRHLALLYLWLGQYDKAEKVIRHALQIPGMCQSSLFRLRGLSCEYRGKWKEARLWYRQSMSIAMNDGIISALENDLQRLKKKKKLHKSTKSKKRSKKKSKKD